ncbi:PhzF family phenazine biosynthesis protein, partial [Arthrobacter sp. MDT2-16]
MTTDVSSLGGVLRYAAFTTDPAGGNPAGVVLDASALDAHEMQAIATSIGYAETAF